MHDFAMRPTMILSDLAWLSGLLGLVALLSTAYRQLTRYKLSSRQISPMTSIFAWTIETTQLCIAAGGATKLIGALDDVFGNFGGSSRGCAAQVFFSFAYTLLFYVLAVFAVDWIDSSVATSSLVPVRTAPFMLTRAVLFGSEHRWVLEPTPLPPWPTSRSKRSTSRHRGSRHGLQTASQSILQNGTNILDGLASGISGQHITFADRVPAFSSQHRAEQHPESAKQHRQDDHARHNKAIDPEAKQPSAPLTPPDSHEGFARSRIRALSTATSLDASPLAAKSRNA